MIDISLYRQIIGRFFPNSKSLKKFKTSNQLSVGPRLRLSISKFYMLAVFLTVMLVVVISCNSSILIQRKQFCTYELQNEPIKYHTPRKLFVGNFYGRCMNGYIKISPKGV